MFGYVKVNSAELKVKEYEFYRGTYCGLCRSMGKCTGQCSRMALSYDFVFLALVRLALSCEKVCFEQKRCFVHPLKKRNSMVRNGVLDYCAGAAAILNYRKVADDLADEKGFKRFRTVMTKPFVAHARKKALKRHPELSPLDSAIEKELLSLDKIEKDPLSGVDAPADSFGRLLGELMAFGLEGSDARIAYEIGKGVGGWIYVADAIDDMSDDEKKKRYNPLLRLYSGRKPDARELEMVYLAIKNRLISAEGAFDLMPEENAIAHNIIANILFLGIPDTTESIIKKQTEVPEKKKGHKEKEGKGKEDLHD